MKENRYDDKDFFLAYSRMLRSEKGLEGAGEWSELKRLLPDFHGKHVLDLGCGYGWHDAYAVQHGAEYVLATDISSRMLERAMEINSNSAIEYRRVAMEDLELPDSSFDIVISSLAFHYISDFPSMARKVHRWLRPGGAFVFSAAHGLLEKDVIAELHGPERRKSVHVVKRAYEHDIGDAAGIKRLLPGWEAPG